MAKLKVSVWTIFSVDFFLHPRLPSIYPKAFFALDIVFDPFAIADSLSVRWVESECY